MTEFLQKFSIILTLIGIVKFDLYIALIVVIFSLGSYWLLHQVLNYDLKIR